MPKFEYNPNNTEGHYPTSIDFIDTEIKKGNKIVATDLVDLYDTYPETQTPDQGDALKYDGNSGIWIPDVGAGGNSCNPFYGYNQSGYSDNSIFIDENTTTPGYGEYDHPFSSIQDCLYFLNQCKTVPFGIILTIQLLSNINIYDNTVLNYIQGDKLEINGNDNTINLYYTELDQLNNEYIPLHLYNNHSIKEIYNVNINHSLIYTTEQYTTDTNGKVDSINGTPVSQLITTEYNEDIYALKINNHSVVKMNNIHNTSINDEIIINKISSSGENDRYDIIYIHKHNIFLDNRSILISDNLTLDKIKVDNSTIIVEKNEYLFDITLWNNSTFILNNAVVHPNVDIYESVYIIEGVEQ